jgi:lipid-binding SYLF domain-containing protein
MITKGARRLALIIFETFSRTPAMHTLPRLALLLGLVASPILPLAQANVAQAASAEDLNNDARQALDNLYRTSPSAVALSKNARAILVFPNIVKAGLIFGGSFGEGVLLKSGAANGYFNSFSASWGLQAGAESYGYAVFLMSNKAVSYLGRSDGWEIGTGPTVVVVDEGVAKNLTTSTLKSDAYAFIFNQQGLMAGLTIEGTKITRIHPNH